MLRGRYVAELVTLDFGAYVDGYCSDITRTLAVGEPIDDMKKIYQTNYLK